MLAPRTAIVFGKGPVAIHAATALEANGYEIKLLVPSTSEFENQPKLAEWGSSHGVAVSPTSDLDAITALEADLGLSVYFDRIFRPRHIAKFGRLVNLHNSLLPRNRGVRPINWALRERDSQHGVTLHEIEPGIDTGPIIRQRAFPIDADSDEVADVYERCLVAARQLIDEMASKLLSAPAVPQDETSATTHTQSDDALLGDRRYWRRGDRTLG